MNSKEKKRKKKEDLKKLEQIKENLKVHDFKAIQPLEKGSTYTMMSLGEFDYLTPKELMVDTDILPFEDLKMLKKEWNKYITKMDKEESYVDSYRIGIKHIELSMNDYKKLETCCGFDSKEVSINGITYVFGCNYGH